MGVPQFFRWLSTRYPRITSPATPDSTLEIDNLYLDMNGIIHPCCHPETGPPPKNENEMMKAIFTYTEHILTIAKPKRVLYIAIDGVAPRAKMNQQRSRRFRAAREARILKEKSEKVAERKEQREALFKPKVKENTDAAVKNEEDGSSNPKKKRRKTRRGGRRSKLKQDMLPQQTVLSDDSENQYNALADNADVIEEEEDADDDSVISQIELDIAEEFDSNVITPGTPFMHRLANALKYWIAQHLTQNKEWKDLKVIFSDASVPGEGEHKIMNYIRLQRSSEHHDPNTVHLLYGLDADLIMLGLATHEINFHILREEVTFGGKRQAGVGPKPYTYLHLNILREYLATELHPQLHVPFEWNLERAIDDWIFLIFFVGNDFLPHMPSLEIREDAIERLVNIWKQNLPSYGNYLTDSGVPSLPEVGLFMESLGDVEDQIFQKRKMEADRRAERARKGNRQKTTTPSRDNRLPANESLNSLRAIDPMPSAVALGRHNAQNISNIQKAKAISNMEAAKLMKETLLGIKNTPPASTPVKESNESPSVTAEETPQSHGKKRTQEEIEADSPASASEVAAETIPEYVDPVRLGEDGWKERYYRSKFKMELNDYEQRQEVIKKYVEGLCWVLAYYYQGCQSWNWYYPYHYAPFSSDCALLNFTELKFDFDPAKPLAPYQQLMGVFPPDSRQAIPTAYHSLMIDADSPILDFYPREFEIDLNGKHKEWQGVALLPFIDEKRLLEAMAEKDPLLSEEEQRMNEQGDDLIIIASDNIAFDSFCRVYKSKKGQPTDIEAKYTQGLSGSILARQDCVPPGSTYVSPVQDADMPDISDSKAMILTYISPETPDTFVKGLLKGAKPPPKVLTAHERVANTRQGGRRDQFGSTYAPQHPNQGGYQPAVFQTPTERFQVRPRPASMAQPYYPPVGIPYSNVPMPQTAYQAAYPAQGFMPPPMRGLPPIPQSYQMPQTGAWPPGMPPPGQYPGQYMYDPRQSMPPNGYQAPYSGQPYQRPR